MSALCGLVRLDGAAVDPVELGAMRGALHAWGPDGGGTWIDAGAGFAQLVAHRSPDAVHERGPLVCGDGSIVTAAGRLDNRAELLDRFGLADGVTSDAQLVARAYEAWGEGTPERLFGDWAFAAWRPRDRRLFLARDHFGNTAMHYYADGRLFAFASGLEGLLAVRAIPLRLDERRLSQFLTIWTVDGTSTFYEGISRLAPSCTITLQDGAIQLRQYWRLEDAPAVRLSSDGEYVERFLELFDEAVAVRLRATGPIAAQLSAGLDSGAVTSLAARQLRSRGERITAFTAVPLFERETAAELRGPIVNEWPAAHETAEWNGNVDHVPVPTDHLTPVTAIERGLDLFRQPEIAAPNLYWNLAIFEELRRRHGSVLLTGQMGNLGVSWSGEPAGAWRAVLRGRPALAWRFIRGWRHAHRQSWAHTVRNTIVRPMRADIAAAGARKRGIPFDAGPLINPDFAARLDLARLAAGDAWMRRLATGTARDHRFGVFVPGTSPAGGTWHALGSTQGIEARDPTADVRLLSYCVGIPDDLFSRPEADRWLMRRAMEGILPSSVQWRTQRGRQSADLAYRLRADSARVTAAIETVAASSRCRDYFNVAQLSTWWNTVADPATRQPSEPAFLLASALMVALFVAKLDD